MILVRHAQLVPEPTSHDPGLMKSVLVGPGRIPGLMQFSRIVIPPGGTVTDHVHEDVWEVFLCTRGQTVFVMDGERVTLSSGDCLAVEPGEHHGVVDTRAETELIYFMVAP